MLSISNLCVRDVLKNLDLTIQPNEFVLIIGANGSGKTTLFGSISGAIRPKAGQILLNGANVTNTPQYKRAHLISSVSQDPRSGTIGKMTILENMCIAYMRSGYKKISNNIVEYFKKKLSVLEMGLESRLSEYVSVLSGGQRQALSLVMSVIDDCKLLLLDEITSALDPKASSMVMRITDKLVRNEGKTCLFITHDTKHMNCFDGRVLEMKDGKLKQKS
ncbi:MAG: ATP-binding cassette domain-containing protein [Holosporales bacterium]|nr:ATP-binding cassette domain-containing protein [Holosporales bacterium]